MNSVDEKVSFLAKRQRQEEEIPPDVPEEFLDPIMSTIMSDPVILPSSLQVVDRTTIARLEIVFVSENLRAFQKRNVSFLFIFQTPTK